MNKLKSIDEINKESESFAKEWRISQVRTFIAMFVSVILFLGFSPSTVLEYIASFSFITPFFLLATKKPENVKHRILLCISCVILSLVLYIGYINVS